MHRIRIQINQEGLAQLLRLALALGITVRHAGSLVMLAGLQAMSVRQSLDSEDTTMYFDHFGKPIEPDRVYGIGPSETKCVLHETQYDTEIDEIVIRKRGSKAPFGRLDETDLAADVFYLVDPKTLTAYESDPREEPADDGLGRFLEDQLANIVMDQHKTLCREKIICARLGVSVSDGSPLADEVCRFVRDPDTVTVGDLLSLKLQSCQSVS
jgi:hypothetical protein